MIKSFSRRGLSFYVTLLVCLTLVISKLNHQRGMGPYSNIAWDVFGYYLHLPATFIYHDPGIEHREWLDTILRKYNPTPALYQVVPGKDNRMVNVYPIGLAVIYSPGFFVAHICAKISGADADGFSLPYQWAVILTSILWACMGTLLLRKILLQFFGERLTSLLVVVVILGTNYYFHAGFDGVMPHNFMFALNCMIILLTIKWHANHKLKHAVAMGFCLALTTISRPTELIWILVPLLWGVKDIETLNEKIRTLFKFWPQLILFGLTMFLVGLPQLLYWKYTTGMWMSNNHVEGFSFKDPYTFQFLFSYKKGWLVYTPVMVLAIAGLVMLCVKKSYVQYACLFFFIVNIYVLSSWECWWYAASFSQRSLVESYPIMAIPLGFMLSFLWRKTAFTRIFLIGFVGFCFVLNLFQTWQILNGILHSELMSKAYYWRIFGRTEVKPEDVALMEIDRNAAPPLLGREELFDKKEMYFVDFDKTFGLNDRNRVLSRPDSAANHCFKMDSLGIYTVGFKRRYTDITNKDYAWIRVTVDVFHDCAFRVNDANVVITMLSKGRFLGYTEKGSDPATTPLNQWSTITVDYLTPRSWHDDDEITSCFVYRGKSSILLDNIRVQVFEPRD